MGIDEIATRAAAAGVDGVLVLDLPIEEAGPFRETVLNAGIDPIFLLSPTTTDARLRQAAELGRGFLYGISRLGVTGIRTQVAEGARAMVERIRAVTQLPIAVGFGLSHPEHVRQVGEWADAAVVGSALVEVIAREADSPDLVPSVERFVGWLKGRRTRQEARGDMTAENRSPAHPDRGEVDRRITEIRERMTSLDSRLVALLNERARCAREIGQLKKTVGLEVYQPQREIEVLRHVRSQNGGPLKADAITRLFERIIDEARRLERSSKS